MLERLTAAQRRVLVAAVAQGTVYPGPKLASTARSLVSRGLLAQAQRGDPYRATEAGRRALEEADHG